MMIKQVLKTLVFASCFYHSGNLCAQSFQDSYEAAMEEVKNTHYAPSEEGDIELRVLNMDGPVRSIWNEEIRKFILHRLNQDAWTADILGRSVMYAPFIEKVLEENEVPVELSYLCLVESQYNSRTISHAGAAGLWQLMPETARLMGLKVNGSVDERFDPYKSTEAAVKYLKYLHSIFNDWGLAVAGYNMGPGRISNLIKEGKGTNYWELRQYLPKETQNYVPAFIAANYLMQFYPWHNIRPNLPNLDLQLTTSVKVTEYLSFATVSQLTEISIATLETLNPAYRKNFLPENPDGNYLILPRRVAGALIDYLNTPAGARPSLSQRPIVTTSTVNPNSYYEKVKITIGTSDNVTNLAKAFYCSPSNIRAWNSLSSYYVSDGQQIRIFQPKSIQSSEIPSNYAALPAATPTQEELIAQEENARKKAISDKYKPDATLADVVLVEPQTPIIVALIEENNNPPSDIAFEKNNIHPALLDEFTEINTAVVSIFSVEETKVENTAVALAMPTVKNQDWVTKSAEIKTEPVIALVPVAKVEETKPTATETIVAKVEETKPIVTEAKAEETKPIVTEAIVAKVEEAKPTATETIVAKVEEAKPTATETIVAKVEEAKPTATETIVAKVEETKPTATETIVAKVEEAKPTATETIVAKVEEAKPTVTEEEMKVAATVAADASLIAKMEDKKAEMQSSISAPNVEEKAISKEIFAFTPDVVQEAKVKPTLAISGMTFEATPTLAELKAKNQNNNNNVSYVYHFIGRNESLSDIAEKYEGVCVSDILALNQFSQMDSLTVGTKIKVKMY
jgi:uncharacterized pyridoxamine 5'-phosphate oxidase family protein